MDMLLLTWMNDWRHPVLTVLMSTVTWLGSIALLLPLAVAASWSMAGPRSWKDRAFLPVSVAGAAVVAQMLKLAFDRERPDLYPSLIPMPTDASFPSAHAFQITAFVAAWLICSGRLRHCGLVIAGTLLVLLVGSSRLYLQVHFPSDVLFGIVGGLCWVWGVRQLPFWRRN